VIVAAAVAVGLAASASTAAAVVAWLRPDPRETSTLMARSVDEVEFHNPGWRPELQAEMANCVRGVTDPVLIFNTYVADFPLGNAVSEADYRRACTGTAATLDEAMSEAPTLCMADRPALPMPTVLLDGGACPGSESPRRPIWRC
jgi:hypothetical protein